MSMSREDVQRNEERAVQRKLENGAHITNDDRRAVQRRLVQAIQRRGTTIPGPVVSASGDVEAVIGKLNSMARGMWANAPDFHGTPVESAVNAVLGNNTLRRQSNTFFCENTSGINMNWSGSIRVTVENPRPVGAAGTGQTQLGGGGTATDTTERSTSTTDSASATGGYAAGDKGGAEGSATLGTSTTTGSQTGTSDTANATISQTSNDTLQRYTGTLVANLTLRAEVAMSGTDYINPFKWGMAAAETISPIAPRSDTVNCGTVTYQMSTGFAPAGG